MDDYAHRHADDALEAFYARVSDIYADAAADARENLETYLKRHEKADQAKRKAVADGKMTQAEYRSWKRAQVLAGKRYQAVLNQVSWGYVNADKLAMAAAKGKLADVYAEAANYTAYTMESNYVGTSFSLVNPDTVQQTLTDSAACMVPTVDASKDYSWNRSHVATALTKGVLLGESIPKIAERVGKVADMGRSAAVRTARTAMTGAENAGRLDMVKRAEAMGLDVELEWVATLDGRTRHSHRAVDGEKVESGKKFSNGCRYPGDPQAPYAEICNCRCTLGYVVGGVGTEDAKRAEKLGGMSYAEWKAGKKFSMSVSSGSSSKSVSSGASRRAWLSQFEPERFTMVTQDGEKIELYGDQTGVEIPQSLWKKLENAKVKHTHTTTIGGTFGVDDIYMTTESWVKTHEVEATLQRKSYRLERTPGATKESAAQFASDFDAFDKVMLEERRYEYWEEHYAAAEVPIPDSEWWCIDKILKGDLNKWLAANAEKYGYKYTSSAESEL